MSARWVWFWGLLGLLVLGCQRSAAHPTAASPGGMTPTASVRAPRPEVLASPEPSATATPTLSPSPTPTLTATPTATATPTPWPTPTPPPNGVAATDALGDGIYCSTGKPARFVLPPGVDIYHAAATASWPADEECLYHFVVLLAEPIGPTGFAGGIEFYHPEKPLRNPPSRTWYFDNLGFLSLNFRWNPERERLKRWADWVRFGRWQDVALKGYRAWVDESGRLHVVVPCRYIPEGATWIVALTDAYGSKCDVLGLGDDGLPALPLPPTPSGPETPVP
ncbi:MAG: hypothetical protein GXO54_01275 [Chloroflexi bacterium]|nr:hypothetical protein [Chloroflexota bacterium]